MDVTSNGWVNTFLIRIPLTKFVRPISVLEEETTEEETQEGQENQEQGSTTQTNTESSGTGQSSDLTEVSA
nr:hypothetical protein [Mycoplasmopsis synoviae]